MRVLTEGGGYTSGFVTSGGARFLGAYGINLVITRNFYLSFFYSNVSLLFYSTSSFFGGDEAEDTL